MKKRLIAILLATVILLSSLPVITSAKEAARYGVTYSYTNAYYNSSTKYTYCSYNHALGDSVADVAVPEEPITVKYGTKLELYASIWGTNVVMTNSDDSVATITYSHSNGTYTISPEILKTGTTTIHITGGEHATYENAEFDIKIEVVKGELEVNSAPKVNDTYEVETQLSDINITPGTVWDKNTHVEVAGSYSWISGNTAISYPSYYYGNKYPVKFTPDNAYYEELYYNPDYPESNTKLNVEVKAKLHTVEIKYTTSPNMYVNTYLKDCGFGDAKAYYNDTEIAGSFEWTDSNWKPTVKQTTNKTLKFTPTDTSLYATAEKEIPVTVNSLTPSITAPVIISPLSYNGYDQNLVTKGSINSTNFDYWTIMYAVTGTDIDTVSKDSSDWSSSIAKAKAVGTYRVWYKVYSSDTDAYDEIAPTLVGDSEIRQSDASTDDSITVTTTQNTYVYTGEEIKPEITIRRNGYDITDSETKTISYENNVNPGEGTIKITFTGNYTGTICKTFTITAPPVSDFKAPSAENKLTYNGVAQTLFSAGSVENGSLLYAVTQTESTPEADSGVWSEYSTDNSLKAVNAGTYYVHYKVTGNEISTAPGYYYTVPDSCNGYIEVSIEKAEMSQYVVFYDGTQPIDYTDDFDSYYFSYDAGNAVEPKIGIIIPGSDPVAYMEEAAYTVEYVDSTNVGKAKATITFKDNANFNNTEVYYNIAVTHEISEPKYNGTLNADEEYEIEYDGFYHPLFKSLEGYDSKEYIVYISYDNKYDNKVDITTSVPYYKDEGEYAVELVLITVEGEVYYYENDAGRKEFIYANDTISLITDAVVSIVDGTSYVTYTVALDETEFTYNGTAFKPNVTEVSINGNALTDDTYSISYAPNVRAGTGSVYVTINEGIKINEVDYSGKVIEKTFTINQCKLSVATNPVLIDNFVYDGSSHNIIKTPGTVSFESDNTEWSYSINNNPVDDITIKEAGAYTVTVYAKYAPQYDYDSINTSDDIIDSWALMFSQSNITTNIKTNYGDSDSIDLGTVTVSPKSQGVTVDGVENKPYDNGNAVTQNITVKDGTVILEENKDYTVSYSNNTDVGIAYITVTLQGNYSGSIIKSFTIIEAGKKAAFSGTSYASLREALKAAKNSSGTVIVIADITDEEILYVPSGVTLDINGFAVTDLDAITVAATGSIIDSASEKGIICADTIALSDAQSYLPVYNAAQNGYSFCNLAVQTSSSGNKYYFRLDKNSADFASAIALMQADTEAHGRIGAVVVYSWTSNNTEKVQTDTINDTILNNYINAATQKGCLTATINSINGINSDVTVDLCFIAKDLKTSISGLTQYTITNN